MTFLPVDGGRGLLPDISVEVDVTNAPMNPTRSWTDITPHVRQISYTRSGRNDELGRTETGTLTALLNNRGDAVTSLGITKSQWVRVQARWAGVTYARWQGIIEGAPRQWPHAGKDAIIRLRAAGVFKILRLYDLEGVTFPAQRNDERVVELVTLAGLTTSSIDTDTDDADAVVTPISQGADALSSLLEIEGSENGLAVEEPDGTVSFQGRHWRLINSSASLATFGEGAGEIPYRDTAELEDDDTRIANIVSVTPAGGSPVTVEDAASQERHWKRRMNRTLLSSNPNVAQAAAEYLLGRFKDPSPRIPAVDVHLAAAAQKDPALVPVLLAAGNSDRFTWSRQATTPIVDDVYVEQVAETISPGVGWAMRFQFSPAIDEAGWVLGDAVFGLLGETTVLVY